MPTAAGGRGPHGDIDVDDSSSDLVDMSVASDDESAVGTKRKRNGAIAVASDDDDDQSDDSSVAQRLSRRSRSTKRASLTRTPAKAPSRSPSTESRDASLSSKRRVRTSEQSMSVANLQAQDHEIARLKAIMISEGRARDKTTLSLRKGVRQPEVPSPKRSRARTMHQGSHRRSPRSPAAADPRLANVRIGVPLVDLDGDDAGSRKRSFATSADAIRAAVLHSTAWRNVKLDVAPTNVLADAPGVALPFALEYDGPLSGYDESQVLATKCAVVPGFAQPRPLSLTTGSPKETALRSALEERVTALIDEATPLIKLAHARRAKTIIAKTRKQVRSYLAALPQHRERVEEIAGSFRPLQISRLEKVATRTILQNLSCGYSRDAEPIVYAVGRGETALSERDILHDHSVCLSKVAAISRSTTCIETRGLIRVDDDPIIRFVPLFSDDANKSDVRFDDNFEGFGGGAKGFVAAADDERKELLLQYVVAAVNGDPMVFSVLKDLGHFKQPLSDYVELYNRDVRATQQRERLAALERVARGAPEYSAAEASAITRLLASYRARATGALLRDRLALPPTYVEVLHLRSAAEAAPDATSHDSALALKASRRDRYNDMAARYQNLFCRRCVAYNCVNHGINQPLPATRCDPRYPAVKASVRLSRDAEAAMHLPDASARDDDPATDDAIGDDDSAAAHATELTADENDDDSSAVRRSVRSLTAASTKASTILISQRSKEKRKSPYARAYRGPHNDLSEYLGHDALYRSITLESRTRLLSPDTPCSAACGKSSASALATAAPSSEWTPAETLVLDKVVACLGPQPCVVAAILTTKSCAAVAAQLRARDASAPAALIASALGTRDHTRPLGARGNSHEHLRRTRVQRMKDRGANHEFVPCNHEGVACNSSDCSCMRRDHYCEKACGCPLDCANRFPGCKCDLGQCRSATCPCFVACRECDPDTCVSCGACELPVEASNAATWREQPKMCGNVNLLRGRMRRVGVAASETHGWGAFAREPLRSGDFIYEYTGELLSQDEAERRGNIYDKTTVSFLFDLNEDAVVDATRKGNKSKFANHTSASPKCVARILRVNGEHRIGIFAKADIAADEELFFDYGYSGVVPDWTQAHRVSAKLPAVGTVNGTSAAAAAPGADMRGDRDHADASGSYERAAEDDGIGNNET